MNDDRLPKKAWNASMKLQKVYKSKVQSFGWGMDIHSWFAKWNVEAYLSTPPEEVDMNHFQMSLLSTLEDRW